MTLRAQVLRRSAHFSQRLSSRVLERSSATAIARTFCADPSIYPAFCRAADVLVAAGALRCATCAYATLRSIIIPACSPLNLIHQKDIHDPRTDFSTQVMDDCQSQLDDPAHIVKPSNFPTRYTHEAQTMHNAGSEIILRQDLASITTEEVSEDDESQGRVHAEKDFYHYIEAEDSPDELLSVLLNLEEVLPPTDPRVCHTCLCLAKLCNVTNQKPEKVVDYARQAFHNFDSSQFPLESATALFLVGMGHYKMGDLNEAVSVLEKCASQMAGIEPPSVKTEKLSVVQYNNQILLGQAKVSLGRNFEGLLEFKKGLAAIERVLSPESPRLASCYQEAALAFLQAEEPKEAIGLCRKALIVFSKCFGHSSSQVAHIRSLMSQIYYELGNHESVLFECQLAVQIFNNLGETDKAISLDLESMEAYFLLGKFHESVTKLNEIIKRTREEDPLHVEALILLVRASNGLKDNVTAAEYSQRALNSLEKKEGNFDTAKTLIRLSSCLQQLQNYEQALAISQRALDCFEKCAGEEAASYAADAQGYRGSLFLSMGKPNEAIPHLEKALKMKKGIYGSDNGELLDVCNHLGVAYAHSKRVDEALAVFQEAKMILNTINIGASLIPIYIYNNLSLTYILSGRIEEAIETKKHAVQLMRKAGKEVLFTPGEAEMELESLVNGKIASISDEQILEQMLPSCMASCTLDKAVNVFT